MHNSIAHAEQIRITDVSNEVLDALLNGERGVDLDLCEVGEFRGWRIWMNARIAVENAGRVLCGVKCGSWVLHSAACPSNC